MASNPSDAYMPGVCNINRTEIAHRRKMGYIGLAVFIVLALILLGLNLNRWLRVVVFIPAFLAAIGFLQAKNRFCVAYGSNGLQNAIGGSVAAGKVTDAASRAKDKRRAHRMNLQAAAAAVLAAIIIFSVPVR